MADNGALHGHLPDDLLPETALFSTISHHKKRAFLLAYSLTGKLTEAARAAACAREMHYHWLRNDSDYVEAFADAERMALSVLEEEATRRALGWDEEHYAKDGTPYTVRKYSDLMLIVRLKALAPEKYRDNARRDERQDVSELLKAVLLELADRQTARDVTPEAEWAPLPPGRTPLPAPPDAREEA